MVKLEPAWRFWLKEIVSLGARLTRGRFKRSRRRHSSPDELIAMTRDHRRALKAEARARQQQRPTGPESP